MSLWILGPPRPCTCSSGAYTTDTAVKFAYAVDELGLTSAVGGSGHGRRVAAQHHA